MEGRQEAIKPQGAMGVHREDDGGAGRLGQRRLGPGGRHARLLLRGLVYAGARGTGLGEDTEASRERGIRDKDVTRTKGA